jgi:hypothetical protein
MDDFRIPLRERHLDPKGIKVRKFAVSDANVFADRELGFS